MPLPARTLTGPPPPATPLPRSRPLHTPHTKRTVSGSSSSSEQSRPDSSASIRGPLSSSPRALSAGGHELDKKLNTAFIAGPTPKKPSVKAVPPRTVKKAAETAVLASTRKDGRSPVESQSRAVLGLGQPVKTAKDRVLVAVRMKPPHPTSDLYGCSTDSNTIWLGPEHPALVRRGGETKGREHQSEFSVDHLHLPPAPTEELYNKVVSPLVTAAMDGYDGTVFAYGMTGSGKTYTMGGVPNDPGVIPRAIDQIFDVIDSDPTRETTLRVSYLEIYNENFRDLLNPTAISPPSVHEDVEGRIVVHGVQDHTVRNPEDVQKLIKIGDTNRRSGKTDWNKFSSRSHAIFTITIESRPLRAAGSAGEATGLTQFSRLNLIDLAGWEKAVSDRDRLKEGSYINKSLLVLGNVIEKLTECKPRSHIPYRDSKLTLLLQDSLSGHARIAVICTVSSDEAHAAQALTTFKFARRVSQVVIKVERGMIASDKSMMQLYRNQVTQLTAELAKANELAALAARRLPECRDSPDAEEDSDGGEEEGLVEEERERLRLVREEKAEAEREVSELELKRTKLRSELNTLSEFTLRSELCVGPSDDGASAALPTSRRRRISDVHHINTAQDVKAAQRRVSALGVVDEDGPGGLGRERRRDGLMATVEEGDLSAKEQALATELGEVRTQLNELLATQSTRASDHDAAVAAFEAQIATSRANLTVLSEEREQGAAATAKLQEDLDSATSARIRLTEQLADLESQIVELNRRRASDETLLVTHAGTIASQQAKAKEQHESVANLQSRIDKLNEQQESNKLSAEAQAASVATLEATFTSLRAQTWEQDGQVAALKVQLLTAETARDSSAQEATSARATLQAGVDNLTFALTELEQRRSREVEALREGVARVEVDRDNKIEAAKKAASDAAETCSSLRIEVESGQQARTVDAKTAADKINTLESELLDARSLRAADAETSAEEVNSLRAQLDEERRRRQAAIDEETASLRAQIEDAQQAEVARLETAEVQLDSLRSQLEESRREKEASTAQVADLETQLESSRGSASVTSSIIADLDRRLADLTEQSAALAVGRKEDATKITRLESELAAERERVKSIGLSASKAQARAEESEMELQEQRTSESDAQSDCSVEEAEPPARPPASFLRTAFITGKHIGFNDDGPVLQTFLLGKPAGNKTIKEATAAGSFDRTSADGVVPATRADLEAAKAEVAAVDGHAPTFIANSTKFLMVCPRSHRTAGADRVVFGGQGGKRAAKNSDPATVHALKESYHEHDEQLDATAAAESQALALARTENPVAFYLAENGWRTWAETAAATLPEALASSAALIGDGQSLVFHPPDELASKKYDGPFRQARWARLSEAAVRTYNLGGAGTPGAWDARGLEPVDAQHPHLIPDEETGLYPEHGEILSRGELVVVCGNDHQLGTGQEGKLATPPDRVYRTTPEMRKHFRACYQLGLNT